LVSFLKRKNESAATSKPNGCRNPCLVIGDFKPGYLDNSSWLYPENSIERTTNIVMSIVKVSSWKSRFESR
jgi:hypothetical protein